MAAGNKKGRTRSLRVLREAEARQALAVSIAEMKHTESMLKALTSMEQRFALQDPDEAGWIQMSSGGALIPGGSKDMPETTRDPVRVRNLSYRMWRSNPHARGIIRNFEKFIVGREFGMDFADVTTGEWNAKRTKLVKTTAATEEERGGKPKSMVREYWNEWAEINNWTQFAKEMVRRSFRDAVAYIRKFEQTTGWVILRFVEPDFVVSPKQTATAHQAQSDDLGETFDRIYGKGWLAGKATTIRDGIEFLTDDPVTIVAYWVASTPNAEPERVPARDMISTKPFADANDPSGILLLEVVMRNLANYTTWEEYRMILNKFRSAIVLHRQVEGTASQAANIIAGRASPRPQPQGKEPVTTSGRREAVPQAGTVITSPPGVNWEFKRPNLDAADAEHDGRRMLLTIAAGMGLPEGIVTADWSNNSYASSVESRTPAVREWEDWQEFFERPIKQIVRWVLDAGIEHFGLPEDLDKKVTLQWPALVTKDADKETNRNALLHERGLMSRTTWAAREDLVLEDEIENMRQEAELLGEPPPGQAPEGGGGGFGDDEAAEPAGFGGFGGFGRRNGNGNGGGYFDEALQDLLHEVNGRAEALEEAVTRTEDGKFASNGPCPESGCGRDEGHGGAHGPRSDADDEAEAMAWLARMEAHPEFVKARAIIASEIPTDQQYSTDGVYTPERQARHDALVQQILNPKAVVPEGQQPVLVLYAGAGGSGKGTVLAPYLPRPRDRFTVINADDVKEKLPEYIGYNAATVHEESSHVADSLAYEAALDARHNVIFDGTGKTYDKYARMAANARAMGYRVELFFAAVEPRISAGRAADRFLRMVANGHPKPRYVDPRYLLTAVGKKPFVTYDRLKAAVDRAVKVDNNANGQPRLLEDLAIRHEARSADRPGGVSRVGRRRGLGPRAREVAGEAEGEVDEDGVASDPRRG